MEVRKQPDQKDFQEQARKIHWVSDNPCGTSWIWVPWWPSHSVPWAWGRELCPSGQIKQKGLWRCWAESLRSLDIGGASGDAVKAQHLYAEESQAQARPRRQSACSRLPTLTAHAHQPPRILKADRKLWDCGLLACKVRLTVLWLFQSFGLVSESISGFPRVHFTWNKIQISCMSALALMPSAHPNLICFFVGQFLGALMTSYPKYLGVFKWESLSRNSNVRAGCRCPEVNAPGNKPWPMSDNTGCFTPVPSPLVGWFGGLSCTVSHRAPGNRPLISCNTSPYSNMFFIGLSPFLVSHPIPSPRFLGPPSK